MMANLACKLLALATLLEAFQPRVASRVPSTRLAATYSDQIEESRAKIKARRRPGERNAAIVDGLSSLAQACEERSRTEGAGAGRAIADQLVGAWKLAGYAADDEITSGLPGVKVVQTFDFANSIMSRGWFLGTCAVWRNFGKFTFDDEKRELSYYVLRTECLGGAFSWEYDEEAILANKKDYENTLDWIDCDGQIAVEKFPDEARWYTLWTRSEAPLASFPFRAKNLGPEAWQEFRTTSDGKWFSQDRT